MNVTQRTLRFVVGAAALLVLLTVASGANAQAVIKVNDDVNFRFGLLFQGWADWNQDPATEGYVQNLFVRRIRLITAGQVAKNVTFFFETDNPNLGKAPKALGSGLIVQDAIVEWKLRDEAILDAGLILIPLCRNCNQSAATLMTIDYGSYSFLQSAPEQSSVGRDTGFQAKGYLADKHLEYRAGAYQGFREANGRTSFRAAGRLQYNVFDVEQGIFYTGTYLGKKKILAFGGGYDLQKDYKAYAGDVFVDWPVAGGDGVTVQADYIHYDGGETLTALPEQNDFFSEAGYYLHNAKLMPFARFEHQGYSAKANEVKNQSKGQFGLAWFSAGHNFSIKAGYTRIVPNNAKGTNQFTVQLQAFYF